MPAAGLSSEPQVPSGRSVVVIGAGLVGLSCAWFLTRRGHQVLLVDAAEACERPPGSQHLAARGSDAALGVLMARVFHRSEGRAWRLRQQSLALWSDWRQQLASRGRPLTWRPGLLLLAAEAEDLTRQRALLEDPRRRQDRHPQLQAWDRQRLQQLDPALPSGALGGLYSPLDGQLDPQEALAALAQDAADAGLERRSGWVTALQRCGRGWRLRLAGGESLQSDWVVLAAGLGSVALVPDDLKPAPARLEPVLGQALELELDAGDLPAVRSWPGAVVWRGINLILRPPLPGGQDAGWRLWLGATLEPGLVSSSAALESIRGLAGQAPDWLLRARLRRHWQGLRARPCGQPAPLLQELGDGLLLAAGHYRNGVLLAPATAAWVAQRIELGHGAT